MKRRLIYYTEATAAELEDFNSPKSDIELCFRSIKELDDYEETRRRELNRERQREHPKKRSPRKRDAP